MRRRNLVFRNPGAPGLFIAVVLLASGCTPSGMSKDLPAAFAACAHDLQTFATNLTRQLITAFLL